MSVCGAGPCFWMDPTDLGGATRPEAEIIFLPLQPPGPARGLMRTHSSGRVWIPGAALRVANRKRTDEACPHPGFSLG